MKHYIIPVFLPELACPNRCVFCNQYSIATKQQIPEKEVVIQIIKQHLQSFVQSERYVELAFFGGNFTGLPEKMQRDYLALAQPFLESNQIQAIRISTRPDYIDTKRLSVLKSYNVRRIELGMQSSDAEVLALSGRGHTFEDTKKVAKLILNESFTLGLQMMIGLPGDNVKKSQKTAADIIRLGAHETRIYPCVVIRDTELENLYRAGTFQPLSLDEAVSQTVVLHEMFEKSGVKVLRMGLHASDDLNGAAFVAGPYHPNFAEMVFSRQWRKRFENAKIPKTLSLQIVVHPSQRTQAIGYKAENKHYLKQFAQKVCFVSDNLLPKNEFKIVC